MYFSVNVRESNIAEEAGVYVYTVGDFTQGAINTMIK